MSTAEEELKDFTVFVHAQISKSDAGDLGLAELFDLWMRQNTSDADYAANAAAINASINDFMSGERGTPAGEHSRVLRSKYGLNNE